VSEDHDHHADRHEGHGHAGVTSDSPAVDPEIAVLEQALRELLLEKGIFTAAELHRAIELMEARDGGVLGKTIVARAWQDASFRTLLLSDPQRAIAQYGASLGVPELAVVENTPEVHNVIVCTLCSCYPRGLLGLPPSWYKSKGYRSRVVREPRAVLQEFGTTVPEGVELRVHDSTADLRYLVLPMRPAGSETCTAAELAELVTRDSMIGVALPRSPARGTWASARDECGALGHPA
jgi:nitrile hydratase